MATLGISTNTRLLGLAIIKQNALVDYSIHLHKSPWSPGKATSIITSLEPCVRKYCIKRVVLSIPYEHYQTDAYKTLVLALQTHFSEKHIPFFAYPPQTLHTFYPEGTKKTKKALMEALLIYHPQLVHCYRKELRNKNRYYIKIFEAAAVATLLEREN